jgi:predicted dehydrogenase
MSNSDNKGVNRRDFLSAGAMAAAAAAVIPTGAVAQESGSGAGSPSPSQRGVVRLGIIGAGTNLQNVQIPGFQKNPQCEILAVANRSLASSKRVTDKFGIPRPYADWQELLADDDIDAVSIGTWPYMHETMTRAVLESGKHVLCQARMANTAAEARQMLDVSRRYPRLVAQLVPMSQSYWQDRMLTKMISDGYVGEVLSVELQRLQTGRAQLTGQGGFADFDGELSWRQMQQFNGLNALNVGQTYESAMRWLGPATRVMAMSKIHVPVRRGPDGQTVAVDVADHIDVMYELTNGAQVHMRVSATTGLSTGNHTWIYGTEGTIHTDSERNIFAGKRGDAALAKVSNPDNAQDHYRVEEEFINAILGKEEVTMNTFEKGVNHMEFAEAVFRSAQSGAAVHLPLERT